MKLTLRILFALILLPAVMHIQGQTTVDLEPAMDNTMFQVPNRYSNGIGPEIYSGTVNNGTTLARRCLIQFSLAEIPAGAMITAVQLELYCTKTSNSGNTSDYDLHRLEESWGEESSYSLNGQGVLADTGDVTWKDRFYDFSNPVEWQEQGGTFVSIPSASVPVNEKNNYYVWSGDQLMADVQDMLDNPDENFGWILKASDESIDGLGRAFASRENEDSEKRPRLMVTYDISTDVKDPEAESPWHIYPNPGSNSLTIEMVNAASFQSYQITDLHGRIIREGELTSAATRIDTGIMQPGYYVLRFPDSDSRPITWIKQ